MKLLRDILGPRQELVVLQLAVSVFAASTLAVCAFAAVLHGGTRTQFLLPDHQVAFVSGPTTRGTSTSTSPNSTRSAEFRAEWERGASVPRFLLNIFFSLWDLSMNPLFRRVLWMLFNIGAPEILMYVAMLEYMSAAAGRRFMHAIGETEWTTTHAFFADMGGFEIEESGGDTLVFSTGEKFYQWKSARSDFALDLEAITEDIADRSKSSGLLKAITCTQASWLVVQTVTRSFKGIPVSELEVLTCAYITCALAVYGFWWHKPYDVRRRIVLRSPTDPGGAVISRARSPVGGFSRAEHPLCHSSSTEGVPVFVRPKSTAKVPQVPFETPRTTPFNRAFGDPDSSWLHASYATGLMGALMGLIHCSLWNTQFVNTRGRLLWRLGCVLQILLPLTASVVAKIEHWYAKRPLYILLLSIAFFYSVARTILLALVVLSFWSLPMDVYANVSWSIPHWQ